MADVQDVVDLFRRGLGIGFERRIVAVEGQRHIARRGRRRERRLVHAIGERMVVLDPRGALFLGIVIAVVAIEADDGVIHPVHVEDHAILARDAADKHGLAHRAQAIDLGFEEIDGLVEAAHLVGEVDLREPWQRGPEDRDVMAELRRNAHVVGDRVRVSRIAAMLHDEQDVHRARPAASAARSSKRRA